MSSPFIRLLWFGVLLPGIGAVALLALGTVWPFRLDHRTLQDLKRVQSAELPATNARILYLTSDDSLANAYPNEFGLKMLAFPQGKVLWATLAESSRGEGSFGVMAVDSEGVVQAPKDLAGKVAEYAGQDHIRSEVELLSREGSVVYDSAETRRRFEERWQFLREAPKATVLERASDASGFTRRSSASVFSLVRLFRLTALLGSGSSLAFLLLWLLAPPRSLRWLAAGGAVMLGVALNFGLAYLLQWLSPEWTHASPLLVWAGAFAAGLACVVLSPARETNLPWPARRGDWLLLGYALAAYLFLFLLRHNFDGDFFYNWLPQGRYHYLRGEHDPAALLHDSGTMQGASYPPGYGITLSLLFWATDLERSTCFLCSEETSFAILTYRVLIWLLNTTVLLMLGSYLWALRPGRLAVGVLGLAIALLLLPTTAAAHSGAETLLFPLLATALLLVTAGRNLAQPGLVLAGLAVGSLATFVKWEGAILFGVGVLPWLLAPLPQRSQRPTVRQVFVWLAVLAVALAPVVLWKLTLKVHNEFFNPVTWQGFRSGLPQLPRFAQAALRLCWANGRLVLLLALPLALLARCGLGQPWSAAVIPLTVYALYAGWVVVFLFANIYPLVYLETSYDRLVLLPTFSAIVYACEVLAVLPRRNCAEKLA
jgi:hypothetical protein